MVFSLKTQSRLKLLQGHDKNVSVVKFSSDATTVVSGSFDNNIIIWDWVEKEYTPKVLKGHEGPVTALALTADGGRIFSGSRDGTVKMWDLGAGELCHDLVFCAAEECVTSCPDSEMVALGTCDGLLRCMNWKSGQCLFEYITLDHSAISSMQFGTDGTVLVCGNALGESTSWSTLDWQKGASVNMPGSITNISFHPDGKSAFLGSSQGEIRHWIVSKGELSKYNLSRARPLNGLCFPNKGNEIIVSLALGYARQWSGPQKGPGTDSEDFRNNLLFNFTLSSDRSRVATATHDSMIRVWDTTTGSTIVEYPTHADGCCCLALNSDGTKIASASPNGAILIWNSAVAPCASDITFTVDASIVSCLSLSPDGSKVLTCLADQVQVWELATKQKLGSRCSACFARPCCLALEV